eukprot:356151-Chlamydomonas_euryale.AAC.3
MLAAVGASFVGGARPIRAAHRAAAAVIAGVRTIGVRVGGFGVARAVAAVACREEVEARPPAPALATPRRKRPPPWHARRRRGRACRRA